MHGYKWPINCTRTRPAILRDGAFRSTAVTAGYHVPTESCPPSVEALSAYLEARKEEGYGTVGFLHLQRWADGGGQVESYVDFQWPRRTVLLLPNERCVRSVSI